MPEGLKYLSHLNMKWKPILQISPTVLSIHQWEAVDIIFIYTYTYTHWQVHVHRTYIFESYLLCLRWCFLKLPNRLKWMLRKKITGSSMLWPNTNSFRIFMNVSRLVICYHSHLMALMFSTCCILRLSHHISLCGKLTDLEILLGWFGCRMHRNMGNRLFI